MEKQWLFLKPDQKKIQKIKHQLNCSSLLATIIANRNFKDTDDIDCFFNPSLKQITPPFALKGMEKATKRICSAIKDKEKILIFGDYDVDGVTSSSVLFEFLEYAGAAVSCHIPHRIEEGYGLRKKSITDVAAPAGIDLIITVDCGASSQKAVKAAKEEGIDVIITDHHTLEHEIKEAVAVINPKQPGCTAGLEHLAGVGVAFYLMIGLRKVLRDKGFWKDERPEPNLKDFCDLVAIGTIADIVPLVKENRIFTRTGLWVMKKQRRPGLAALTRLCAQSNKIETAEDVSFTLSPRLNAAGRMDNGKTAFDLLTAGNEDQAEHLANILCRLNTKRKDLEQFVWQEARQQIESDPGYDLKKTIVLEGSLWHEGVIGIVASKLVRQYHKPVVLFSTRSHMAKGSGRSIEGIDLYKALASCKDILDKFGGHKMAAGLSLNTNNLDAFRNQFESNIDKMTSSKDYVQKIHIDCPVSLDQISGGLIDEIDRMQPLGEGNPWPVFMAADVQVVYSAIMAKCHRRMVLRQKNGRGNKVNAVMFNPRSLAPLPRVIDKIAFRIKWNQWNGNKTPQLIIEEISR